MKVRNLGLLLLATACTVPLHAAFVGSTCYTDFSTCVATDTTLTTHVGTTTYDFSSAFTGAIVGGKPTLGTIAAMTVSDPNGVPVLGVGVPSSASVTFTDHVLAAPAAVSAWTF